MKKIILFMSFVAGSLFAAPIPGSFIVQVRPQANPVAVANRHGIAAEHVYTAAVNGFAGMIPAARLNALQRDPDVLLIEQDIAVSIGQTAAQTSVASATTGDAVPTGVARIGADLNPRTDASAMGVAIIDTGISLTHPDLNVAGSVSYVRGVRSGNDDNGHGSHVAGIVAAKINGIGIRGVAPNARLFAVKVLDKSGSGALSAVVSGIDWVTKNAAAKGIRVANMSLGFSGTSSTLDSAISTSVNSGVVYVVAAGNSAANAGTFSPANHPMVIAVSAMADTDGSCGGAGVSASYGADDAFASFSNYGSVVAIAAPGVDIYSTYKSGGYATLSGTSMAAPHVAGAAAHLVASNPSLSPADVKSVLQSTGTAQSPVACWQDATGRTRGGFSGDVDGYVEPLVDAAGL